MEKEATARMQRKALSLPDLVSLVVERKFVEELTPSEEVDWKASLEEFEKLRKSGGEEEVELILSLPRHFGVRFVKGSAFESTHKRRVKRIVDTLLEYAKWHKQAELETVLQREHPGLRLFRDDCWPMKYYGRNRDGYPIVMVRLRDCNWKAVTTSLDVAQLMNGFIVHQEVLIRRLRYMKTSFRQIVIFDMGGMRWQDYVIAYRNGLVQIFGIWGKYYPESVQNLLLINTPAIFRTIFSLVKRWIEPDTLEKIGLYKNMPQIIDRLKQEGARLELFPLDFGGKGQGHGEFIISDEIVSLLESRISERNMEAEELLRSLIPMIDKPYGNTDLPGTLNRAKPKLLGSYKSEQFKSTNRDVETLDEREIDAETGNEFSLAFDKVRQINTKGFADGDEEDIILDWFPVRLRVRQETYDLLSWKSTWVTLTICAFVGFAFDLMEPRRSFLIHVFVNLFVIGITSDALPGLGKSKLFLKQWSHTLCALLMDILDGLIVWLSNADELIVRDLQTSQSTSSCSFKVYLQGMAFLCLLFGGANWFEIPTGWVFSLFVGSIYFLPGSIMKLSLT